MDKTSDKRPHEESSDESPQPKKIRMASHEKESGSVQGSSCSSAGTGKEVRPRVVEEDDSSGAEDVEESGAEDGGDQPSVSNTVGTSGQNCVCTYCQIPIVKPPTGWLDVPTPLVAPKLGRFGEEPEWAQLLPRICRKLFWEPRTLYVVVDTCVFLEDLAVVKKLKNDLEKKMGDAFVICYSYTVSLELDKMNHNLNKKKALLQYNARQSLKLVDEWFQSHDPTVKGENPVVTAMTRPMVPPFRPKEKDDEIQEWALQLKYTFGRRRVAVLTEDRDFKGRCGKTDLKAFNLLEFNKWMTSSATLF